MLFHIKQTHTPENCPYGKGGSRSLFDSEAKDVKLIGYWLAFAAHTNYLVVETDDIGHLHNFPAARRRADGLRDHAGQRQADAEARLASSGQERMAR